MGPRLVVVLEVFLLALAVSLPAGAREVETPHFRFVADQGAEGVAARLARVAEDKRTYVLGFLGIEDDRRVEVRVASDDEAMSRMVGTQRPVREWVAGLAWPDRALVVLSARGNEVFTVVDTFEHEMAHLYLDTALRGRPVPRWFHEGVAMLVASEGVAERLKTALGAAATGAWLSWEDLERGFPAEAPAVHLAYAQAMLFVRHLHRAVAPAGVSTLIAEVANGMPFEAAFKHVFGGTVEEVWERARGEVDRVGAWVWFVTSAAVLWVVITALFLYVYARKRRRAALKREAWALQEELARQEALNRAGLVGGSERPIIVPGPNEVQ